jgi:hypothetical protein
MTDSKQGSGQQGGGWRLAALLIGVVVVVLVVGRYQGVPEGQKEPLDPRFAAERAEGTLALTLKLGEEPARRLEVPVAEPVLLLDAMQEASRRDPEWRAKIVGNGEGALLTELAGRATGGAGGNNWLYELNGETGEVGIGACTVAAGDDVLWKFAPYD